MPWFVALSLLLTGCSAHQHQKLLDTYLFDSAQGRVSEALVGDALRGQIKALEVLKNLGWSQSGQARYFGLEVTEHSIMQFCLDVSDIRFTHSSGSEVELNRIQEKLLMTAHTVGHGSTLRISSLQEVGKC